MIHIQDFIHVHNNKIMQKTNDDDDEEYHDDVNRLLLHIELVLLTLATDSRGYYLKI